ncbi:MAG: formylglycine-generating enzyme family protein [Desulfobacterales bacterium]|nr:formylglycine-generating enzyme family protein [Desulfobacterales bacterium]
MSNITISLAGIEDAVASLNYRPNSPKYKALMAIKSFYTSEESIGEINQIPTDALIRSIWDVGDDPSKLKSKRRNFSSLKSSINTDLTKLTRKGGNPENITISETNTLDMTEEAKNELLNSFTDAVKTNDLDIDQASNVLKAISDFLKEFEEEAAEDGEGQDIVNQIKSILDRLKDGGGEGFEEIELEEDEELEIIDEDEMEEIDDDEFDEIHEDDLEEIEELDDDLEEVEIDEDEELEEIDEDELEEVDGDDLLELDGDEEIEEVDDEDLEIIDGDDLDDVEELDEDLEEIELDEDEELEEIDEDELEEIDEDDLLELDEDEELEEIDDEDLEIIDEDDLEDLDELDDELEEIEELDDDVEEIELDEDEELEEVDELDEEEQQALEDFRAQRALAEEFDNSLSEADRHYNSYVKIPEGLYTIGTTKNHKNSLDLQQFEMPKVYMGRYPVTNALFEMFVEATGYITTAEKKGKGIVFRSRFKKGKTQSSWKKTAGSKEIKGAYWYQPNGPGSSLYGKRYHPVVQVSVDDAIAFAAWIGRRLPTEAEWESAARTDSGYTYPWGDEFHPRALNIEETALADTSPVDEFDTHANEFGVADLLGNVREWTMDTQPPPFKTRNKFNYCVAKGGGWNAASTIAISSRALFKPDFTANTIGFRCISEYF